MEQNVTKVMIVVVNLPLKEEKEGGEDRLKELLSSMLELLGETGKAEAGLLHHLAPAGKMSVLDKKKNTTKTLVREVLST